MRRDGTVLGQGTAGPANVTTDIALSIANVRAALLAAAAQTGLTEGDLAAFPSHIGLAGVLTDAQATDVARALPMVKCTVTDDCVTSVAGALGARDGALIAVGTGSTIAGQRNGRLTTLGGWGFVIGDQASGAWLGRALLEQVLLCFDGLEPHSDLTRLTLAGFGDDPNRIVPFARDARPSDFASHVPAILDATKAGDPVGQILMRRGAAYLDHALETLAFAPGDALCLTGGIGQAYADYLAPTYQAAVTQPLGTALDGALALARRATEEATA
jgi:glucosamine kinase